MRSRLALLVAPLLLATILPAAVSAAAPTRDAKADHRAAVLAYWTPARMRAATPRDFTVDAVRGLQPQAKPGGGGGSTSVTGASWTGGGKMLTTTGRALFTMGGTDYICSGSVVNDTKSTQAVVLTAGHCVVENDGVFATNWLFIPEFDSTPTYTCNTAKVWCWVTDALYADAAFAGAGSFDNTAVQHDWAVAFVSAGDRDGGQLDAKVGSFPIAYTGVAKGTTLSAFGYPEAGKYNDRDLTYCRGVIGEDANTGNTTWSMGCDMTGGSSGGPWVKATNTTTYADAVLSSLNSYGYSGTRKMFGPKFNTNTKAVFDAANSGTLGTGVVRTLLP